MPRKITKKSSLVLVSVHLPREMLREIDELVRQGRYPSRAELIRVAIYDMLNEMLHRPQQQQQRDPPDPQPDPPEDPPVDPSPQPVVAKTKAEEERERSMRYRACVEKLLNMLLSNLGEFKFNVRQDGAYKIPKKIIVRFFTEDCRMHKSVVAPAYSALVRRFMRAGFSVFETQHAFILQKPQVGVVTNA